MAHENDPASQFRDENAQFDDLLYEYVDRLNAGEILDKEAIQEEQPDHAEALIEKLQVFEGIGIDRESAAPLGTLGDYTLRRQIGRGGMGVVYEAWENSMDRRVALKVMPAAVAADTRAVSRFIREAQVAGKLNHPNVVAVYGMGVKEQTPYYAMELVEGETLAQILAKIKEAEPETDTPFGPKDQVDYFAKLARAFADVADGLQHAHSRGVIHRDIKPSNLILDSENRLRILDFGLARLEGQESLTLSGDFVGTPLYMSPEQARRKKVPVDHRSDVYSLGASMYEALTGRPPFRGKDPADTLSQIIQRDPVEPRRLARRVPKDLETIVLKCLRKDAGDRYGTAEALAQDLRRLVRGDPIEARPQMAIEKWGRRAWRYRSRIIVGALLCALVASLGAVLLTPRPKAMHRVWEASAPAGLTGTLSRDGRYLSYVDWTAGNLAVADLTTETASLVTKNSSWDDGGWNDGGSAISPDGERIAYNWYDAEDGHHDLRLIKRDGSGLTVLLDGLWLLPLDWSPDGKDILVFGVSTGVHELGLVSVADPSLFVIRRWQGRRGPTLAKFSPDGRYVAFDLEEEDGERGHFDIFLISTDGGTETALVDHPADDRLCGWAPDGQTIFFSSDRTSRRSLWAIDVEDGQPRGSARVLKEDFDVGPIGFADDGSYYYKVPVGAINVHLVELDGASGTFAGEPRIVSWRMEGSTCMSDWSPDGTQLAYRAGRGRKNYEPMGGGDWIFSIYTLDTGKERLLVPSPPFRPGSRIFGPRWSPDGRFLFVLADKQPESEYGIYKIDVASEAVSRITDVKHPMMVPPAWSHDGASIFYAYADDSTSVIVQYDLSSGNETEVFRGKLRNRCLDLSPDDHWLAFYHQVGAAPPGTDSIVVLPSGGGEAREVVRLSGEERSRRFVTWTPDGEHLLFDKRDREIWRVNVETGDQEKIHVVAEGVLENAVQHPQGGWMAFTQSHGGSEVWVMESFLSQLEGEK